MLRGAMAARGSKEEDVLARLSLVGRFGDAERDRERRAVAVLGPSRRYTIGHVLSVDGGYLAR